ncbi:class I SAM-dependent methyltransferase [Bacillus sp. RO3]|nr:class I SAM-dependent methyltransferase [Bacillus sp. RO3]
MFSLQKQFKRPNGVLGWFVGKIMEVDNRKINNWSIRQLSIQDGDRVLEVGYGPGYCIHHICRRFPRTSVDGVDISETMKDTAWNKNATFIEKGRARLFVHDISHFRINDAKYDRIFSVNNYPLWNNQKKSLSHLYDMLKTGGILVITVQPRGEEERDSRAIQYGERISDALHEAGFKDITLSYKKVRPALTVCVKCVK